ncbi:Type II secretory pathway, pullulanase PulA and related glycosidase [Ruminococcus sp. 5_1_39BFAA]|uniref:Type II secretory pathway, pullulanase PulA and related glycosidase n=1 Tax=Ruminococcus sp. 5_1_39BFAA TaxID=457412 RepID=UPI003569BD6B
MTNQKNARIQSRPGYPLVLGANRIGEDYNFCVETQDEDCVSILLYKKQGKEPFLEIPLTEEHRTGRIYSVLLTGIDPKKYEYNFKINGKICADPCAYSILGKGHYGAEAGTDEHKIRCGFLIDEAYDWEDDVQPGISYEDMILYKVHVRGYTKLAKIEAKKKGTFAGLVEMIPYWKELGINAVELMPACEYMEVEAHKKQDSMVSPRRKEGMLNYWGYTRGFYLAPKSSYCATKNPENEFRDMVKAFHKAGIACIMELFFTKEVNPLTALRTLQFWKRYYHVDGFHILGEGAPVEMILKDGILADTLVMAAGMDTGAVYHGKTPKKKCFGEYNPGFLQDMRRFLKSDEEMVRTVQYRIRRNPADFAVINYMTCQDGFTMNDLVSYNYKHNEENGEDNMDGSSYNYSWNCGVEGPSRKAAIRLLRERQIRNAFVMMLFSQGVPMIYGGDEIGNSQNGNNNAYCQDNPVGWIDWKGLKKNEKLLAFVKKAIQFRKDHPILHMKEEMKETDYLANGFPDMSFHGERAWYCNSENTSRLLGVMYCGAYAEKSDGTPDDFIYIGFNFHWENRKIALPNLPDGMVWKKVMDTGEADGFCTEPSEGFKKSVEISPRTIVVLMGRQEVETDAPVASLQNDHKA